MAKARANKQREKKMKSRFDAIEAGAKANGVSGIEIRGDVVALFSALNPSVPGPNPLKAAPSFDAYTP